MDIKPIETIYNGYRFRSRLEARWAVFFDAAGIKYEYEPEGFDLGDGLYYLPDFYLPDFQVYVEIKPSLNYNDVNRKKIYEQQEAVCEKFAETVGAIFLMRGSPWDNIWGQLFAFFTDDDGGGSSTWEARFVDIYDYNLEGCLPIIMCMDRRMDVTIYLDSAMSIENPRVCNGSMMIRHHKRYAISMTLELMVEFYDPESRTVFNKAKTAARQARFEHGEKPRVGARA